MIETLERPRDLSEGGVTPAEPPSRLTRRRVLGRALAATGAAAAAWLLPPELQGPGTPSVEAGGLCYVSCCPTSGATYCENGCSTCSGNQQKSVCRATRYYCICYGTFDCLRTCANSCWLYGSCYFGLQSFNCGCPGSTCGPCGSGYFGTPCSCSHC